MTDEVFISYSWDSPEHTERVLALSNRLRADGVDCVLDQYEESPPEGWPRWMDKKVRDAKFVLMICTPTYYRRVMGEEAEGLGKGVRWEGNLIYQHLYNAGTINGRFVPVLFDDESISNVPAPMQGATIYRLEQDFLRLYARLTGQVYTAKPALGERKPLPAKEVKTDPTLYFTSAINIDLWNEAKWRATFYLFSDGLVVPPVLGFAYLNVDAGVKIFQEWIDDYGEFDEFESLRVSIVELDTEPGSNDYIVHVSADPDAAAERFKQHGFKMDDDLMLMVSRFHRMEPSSSQNLDLFKQAYRKHKMFYLCPGLVSPDMKQLVPNTTLGIRKGKIEFRKASEVGEHDPDSIVLASHRDLIKRD